MKTTEILDDRIRCLHDAFTAEECAGFVRVAEAVGFHEAPITTSRGFVMRPDIRNNTRVIHDDERLAASLWERVAPAIPARIGGYTAVGLNERFRFYRYAPGQFFAWHYDGAYHRDGREQSLLTWMLYLDDGFEGGSTDFDVPDHEGPLRVVPERGMVLVFQHHLCHQGAPVRRGVKQVLRTDVMYRRDAA
jgi:predicted 2-oxoglutarate/Fe(II)-dependent dioxygenase YbiX